MTTWGQGEPALAGGNVYGARGRQAHCPHLRGL